MAIERRDGLTENRIEGSMSSVKTTIDIPAPLYKRAKIRAVERGETLKALMLRALERDLDLDQGDQREGPRTFSERRRLLPEFELAMREGLLAGEPDSTRIISDDRDSREDGVL